MRNDCWLRDSVNNDTYPIRRRVIFNINTNTSNGPSHPCAQHQRRPSLVTNDQRIPLHNALLYMI